MPDIRVGDVTIDAAPGAVVISARVDSRRMAWHGERLWLKVPPDLAPATPSGDPFAAGLLLPAMAAGLDLVVDAPVSPSLAANLGALQDVLVACNRRNPLAWLHRVRLDARPGTERPAAPRGMGLFFTGGVDSMYSLLRARHETGRALDALLFVEGYDIPLGATVQTATVVSHLGAVAAGSGVRLITIATNLRRFTDPALCWEMAHGGGLAAAGHVLADGIGTWTISSSDSHVKGTVSGTAPGLDSLWSGGRVAFRTAGEGIDRQRKIAALAGEPLAQRHLVVCWQRRTDAVNCGRCPKCVSTMLQLLVFDALEAFETFPNRVDPALLSSEVILAEPIRAMVWEMLLIRLRGRPEWAPLTLAVEELLARTRSAMTPPALGGLLTCEGRQVAVAWLRSRVRRRLPVPIRRRLLAWRREA